MPANRCAASHNREAAMRSTCGCARHSRSASSLSSGQQSPRPPRCGRPSPCSHPRTGAARNDAQTTGLVEAVKAEEGAGCANVSTDPGAACDDASPASRAARNDAAAASASVEAKQCFKSWWMSMRLAPNYTESSTVVATLRFPIAPMLLPSAASDRNPRNDRRHPRQHSQAWLAGRRNSPPSQLASDPTMSGAYCATM